VIQLNKIYNFDELEGKKFTFSGVFVDKDFAYFYIKNSEDKLVLHLHEKEEKKIYELINTYVSYQWRETGYPFPIEISFEEREKAEKKVKENEK
jgi:hypothetical protein